ncbi:hypothetical protein FWK35_00004815 [Aphis craccivora]|nr:hypothetical protein FWK35_00038531 [Aphis craccivora]KAF0751397.1 hypothetical protein FWK35_00028257 [Aphis craccivora]KAF0752797.1 hypothetical protein FWK35_00031391 [Aphis craccivora]KAF0772000.1 hypothetical protein FWK35_00004815 [Aphis craccivora]
MVVNQKLITVNT